MNVSSTQVASGQTATLLGSASFDITNAVGIVFSYFLYCTCTPTAAAIQKRPKIVVNRFTVGTILGDSSRPFVNQPIFASSFQPFSSSTLYSQWSDFSMIFNYWNCSLGNPQVPANTFSWQVVGGNESTISIVSGWARTDILYHR